MLGSLVTYYVLIVIELSARRVQVAGITPTPDSAFTKQVGRNLTNEFDGFLLGKRFLIIGSGQEIHRGLSRFDRALCNRRHSFAVPVTEFEHIRRDLRRKPWRQELRPLWWYPT